MGFFSRSGHRRSGGSAGRAAASGRSGGTGGAGKGGGWNEGARSWRTWQNRNYFTEMAAIPTENTPSGRLHEVVSVGADFNNDPRDRPTFSVRMLNENVVTDVKREKRMSLTVEMLSSGVTGTPTGTAVLIVDKRRKVSH